jgi:O-antigen/teichoic acid export membrane protein
MRDVLTALGRDSAIYGAANAGTAVLAFLLVPIYTHRLTTSEFGAYSLVAMIYSLLSIVGDCGLSSSVARYYFDESTQPDRIATYRRRLLSTAFLTTTGVSVALSLLCFGFADLVSRQAFGVSTYGPWLRIVAVTLFLRSLTIAPMVYLRVGERSAAYGLLTVLQMSLFLVFNFVFVVMLDWGVSGILYSQLASTTGWALCALGTARNPGGGRPSLGIAKDLLRLGLPLVPALPLMWIIELSDRYMVEHYASTAEVGLYSLGYRFGFVMTFPVMALALGWTPLSMKIFERSDSGTIYARVTSLYLAAAGLMWLVMASFSSEMVGLLSAKEFHGAAIYIPPVAFAYLLYGFYNLSSTGLGLVKRNAPISWATFVAAAANVGLNIWLIPRFGALAAAYTTIVSYAILASGCLFFAQRLYPIPFRYWQWAQLLGGMIALAAIPSMLPVVPWPAGVAIRLALLILYGGLVLAAGVVQRDEVSMLASALSRSLRNRPPAGASASS